MPRRDENYNDMLSRLFATEGEKEHVVTATLQVTDACNLRCTYCYQINKHTNRMSFETGRKFIDMLLSETGLKTYYDGKSTTGIILEFIGGEPLLEIDLIDQLTDYFISEMIRLHHPLLNRYRISICSNGVLYFDERVQRYIKKHLRHLSFSISIDGNKELHDACRVFPDGSGSYDIAMKGVRHFVDVLGGNMGSKMTLAPQNISHTFEAVKGLIDSGYKEIHLNCVYEEGWTAEHAKILYDQLKKLADYMVDNDLTEEIYVAMFEQDFFRPKREDDLKNWCGGNGEMISCDYKGDIYPCIRYMESSLGTDVPPLIVGNLETGVLVTPEQRKCMDCLRCIDRRSQSTDECFNCPIAEGCSWCFPAGTQVLTPEGMRNIETLRAGDKVIDGDGAERSVTANMSRTVWKDELTFVKAAGFPATLVTKEHPFWAKRESGEPGWAPAFKLQVGDKIALYNPQNSGQYIWASVSSCGDTLPDQETVYNLTVDGTHTYIANGAVVHNCTAYNYQVFGTPDKRATYICIMHKARALANAYFWNKKFRKEGSHKRMKLWIPEDWALEIINKEEWNLLKKMEGI